MTKIVRVTRAQVKAARAIVERDKRTGRISRPGVVKIASAK